MQSSSSSVRQAFFSWADQALSRHIPDSTVAFHFNLYEGENGVRVQLMGIDSFIPGDDPERDYWPGKATFSTGKDRFDIPYALAGSNWPEWLQTSMDFVRSYIADGNKSSVLKSTMGVGIGFVDGDMHVLWQQPPN